MINLAVLDFRLPKGHKNFNSQMLSVFSCGFNVITRDFEKPTAGSRLSYLKNTIKQLRWANGKANNVVVLSFETVTFAIASLFIGKRNVFMFHHNNTDELRNSIKRFLFKTYMNRIYHFVFADFIKEYLVEQIGVSSGRVFVVPHPISDIEKKNVNSDDKEKVFVGISGSNDEDFISEIVECQKEKEFLNSSDVKVILKSKAVIYKDDFITVDNRYLSSEEYEGLFDKASAIILMFPKTYVHRMSASMFDAFLRRKVIFCRRIKIFEYYSQRYPNNIKLFDTLEELKLLIDSNKYSFDENEFINFKEEHSSMKINDIINDVANQGVSEL